MELAELRSRAGDILDEVERAIVGKRDALELILLAVLCDGHVLLEDYPGLAKTLIARSFAYASSLRFSRIQFTPDLMPSDVTGASIFDQRRAEFEFVPRPIFTNILLADEINRAPPKTQAALLEAMQEHQVTAGGKRHKLPNPFFVLATQNPIEQEGTYPLPEAQLDRFLLKVIVPQPSEDELCDVLTRTTGREQGAPPRVMARDGVLQLRALCRDIAIAEPVVRYAARLVRASDPTDKDAPELVKKGVRFGAAVRGAQSLVLAGKAVALCEGRANVSFADVQKVAKPALRHRIIRSFEGEADGITTDAVIDALLAAVPTRPAQVTAEQKARA